MAPRLAPLLSALGVSIFLQQAILAIAGLKPVRFPDLVARETIVLGPVAFTNVNIIVLAIAVALLVGLHLFVNRTMLGIHIRAVAEPPRHASSGSGSSVPSSSSSSSAWTGAIAGLHKDTMAPRHGGVWDGRRTEGLHGGDPGRHRQHSACIGGFLLGLLETFGAGLLPVLTNDLVSPTGTSSPFRPS